MTRILLRFLFLGALLFAASRWPRPALLETGEVRAPTDDDLLLRDAMERGLDRLDPVVARRLVQNMAFVEADGGVREARRLGMTHDDVVVRRRLIERMRAVLAGEVAEPSDEELQDYLADHAEELTSPPRLRISQIFLGNGPAAEARAHDLLAPRHEDLRAKVDRDGGPWPGQLPAKSPTALARLFGQPFAETVGRLPVGRWSGPVRSAYGLHLVRVEERTDPSLADFATLRPRLRAAFLAERRQANLTEALAARRGAGELER